MESKGRGFMDYMLEPRHVASIYASLSLVLDHPRLGGTFVGRVIGSYYNPLYSCSIRHCL